MFSQRLVFGWDTIFWVNVFHFLLQNQFLLTRWENCERDNSIVFKMNLENTKGMANKLIFSGEFDIVREIQGPLELSIEASRCDLSMSKCESLPIQKFNGLCKKLRDTKAFYYDALMSIHPPLHCPFQAQNYTMTNSSIDLMGISFLPLSDSLWVTTCKLYAGETKRRELVMCTQLEMRINRIKSRRKNWTVQEWKRNRN